MASTSAFLQAMDERTMTENGAICHTSTASPQLDLFFKLVRDLPIQDLEALFARAVAASATPAEKADLVVLAFQTRGTRGMGKGEKLLTYNLIKCLANAFGAESLVQVIGLLPSFGYWKDLVYLLAMADCPQAIADKCITLLSEQLLADEAELAKAKAEGKTPNLSLAAKYAPRENSSFDRKEKGGLAKRLALALFGEANPAAASRKYRKLCSSLNLALNTTECLMSAGRWEEIRFGSVASLCLQRHRKAFLNEALKGSLLPSDEATGNRHPHDPARVAARAHLRETITSKKGVQGKALLPHEIARKCMHGGAVRLSTLESDLLDAQWTSMREGTLEVMRQAAEQRGLDVIAASVPSEADPLGSVDAMRAALPKHVDLGKLVPLVDVSGSMSGTPMEVAIALGILVSELTAPTFRDRILTFESSPQWVSLAECHGIRQKVEACERAPWGGSTDFEAACERILETAERARLTADEIPDLIVFSDMQFDQAAHGFGGFGGYGGRQAPAQWSTSFERLQRRFAVVGQRVCGAPYAAPRIIFWNLRSSVGFPACGGTPNVQMLSGFSPALLKLVVSGADLVADEVEERQPDGSIKVVRSGPTPEQTYRAAIEDSNFDIVRLKLSELEAGPFKDYVFVRSEGEFEVVDVE
eukprot:CAMPEP_0115868092 /NCGR_PEP_ID=MMETSP0287-20121206/21109_1 /TAXON_ID=412157 /ORGANISM="Chrysochromulina rotalis, Strain UIO044" /LENGTH=644 /DNA_ID=CAMNT_0003322725 /DNA_START=37 /DNA_END=1971 /DNA_ORIENTATION=+